MVKMAKKKDYSHLGPMIAFQSGIKKHGIPDWIEKMSTPSDDPRLKGKSKHIKVRTMTGERIKVSRICPSCKSKKRIILPTGMAICKACGDVDI